MQRPAGCQLLSAADAHHGNVSRAGYCLSEQMFPAPLHPPPPIVRTTEANPLLLNTLPEADGHRPEDPSILNLTVGATCGLEVSSRQAVHLEVCSCCWMHLH